MIVLNNVAVGDTYTDATTVLGLSISNVSLFVFNNAVTFQLFKKNPGGGLDYELLPEQNMAPGSAQFPGAIGLKIKNAVPGAVARIILVAPEYNPESPDPGMVGYTPTTLKLTASGGIGAVASPFYAKNNSLVDITNPAGNVETDILNVQIKASDIDANSQFLFSIACDYLDNVASGQFTIRAYIGATKIIDSGPIVMEFGAGVGGSRMPYLITGTLALRGALNSQATTLSINTPGAPGSAAPVTGEGTYNNRGIASFLGGSSVDMSIDQTFRVAGLWNVNDVNHSFRKFNSVMQLF